MRIEELGEECELVNTSVESDASNVATVELDRPDARNALNSQMRAELKRVLEAAEEECRVVVLTGSREADAFSAGGDVTELRDRDAIRQLDRIDRKRVFHHVYDLDVPVVGMVNGHAIGGGCELAQACDIRLAHADALFGQPETNIGIFPGAGGTQWLTRLVGRGQAMRMILTGENLDASEAKEIGLVEEVYDDHESLAERAYEVAEKITEKSPLGTRYAKRAVKSAERLGVEDGLEYEGLLYAHLFNTRDKDEGISAFLEGRDPSWEGR